MQLTRLRGFQDLVGPQAELFSYVEERARAVAERYGVREIRIPLMERAELFMRSTGETSDIVEKQMYVVQGHEDSPRAGNLVLRPEGTPGVVRAYIEAGLDRSEPEQRFFYSGPMLRYERPQKGRYRQFFQFGVEVLGRADAACDTELIVMVDDLRRELGLSLRIELNSLGDSTCRPAFRRAVLDYARGHHAELCVDCRNRLDRNPLRILDCKIDVALAAGAPKSIDYLCEPCRKHLDTVAQGLARSAVEFTLNPRIVRGLDYYVRTAFEVTSDALGAQNAVGGGGRYDGLVAALGGADVPGVGFALGVDRLALALQATSRKLDRGPEVVVIALGEAAINRAFTLVRELRDRSLRVEMLSPERSLKALLKRADRLGASHAVIIGEDELARGVVQVRDLLRSDQREVKPEELPQFLHGDLGTA